MDNSSSYPALMQSNVDIASVLDSSTTDSMLARVKTRAFKDTGVMPVLNVDSGEDENVNPHPKKIKRYKNIAANSEMVRDIIGRTMQIRPVSTSIEVLEMVAPFVDDNNSK